jgi:hypothetical protein
VTDTNDLRAGDQVPHFDVQTTGGEPFSYTTIWQRRNLVLVISPDEQRLSTLLARRSDFQRHNTVLVATAERVPGLPAPCAVVADKWGEIIRLWTATELPAVDDLLDWVEYVEMRCPECEGESH